MILVAIHDMRDEDCSAVSRVVCDSFEWGARREDWPPDRIEEYVVKRGCEQAIREQFREYRWLLARSGTTIVGVVATKGNEITKLFVSPDRLRRGIGAALFKAAEKTLRRDGRQEVILGVIFDSSVPFYEAMGMSKVGRKSVVFGPATGADPMIMKKSLQSRHLATTDVLQGKKVCLRLPRVDELPFIRTLWSDPDTMVSVGGPADFPEAKAKKWFERMVEPGGQSNCYCLILDQSDTPVGEISFHQWNPEQRSAELNVKILAACRGHGYAKDALCTFLKFYFGQVGGRLMTDDIAPDNRPGQRLLESVGFQRDDTVSDVCRMTMTKRMHLKEHGEPNKPDAGDPPEAECWA